MSDTPDFDVEIAAGATARQLHVRSTPDVDMHADETVSERERLPRPVRTGVYRHVRAAMRAGSRVAARTKRAR